LATEDILSHKRGYVNVKNVWILVLDELDYVVVRQFLPATGFDGS
jgi:hypothetical protein